MASFILVAGAWHGAWCWEYVIPLLEARGHRAVAAELPGMGADRTPLAEVDFTAWAQAVAEVVETAAEPVILVGHSGGGPIAWAAVDARPEKVARVVSSIAGRRATGRPSTPTFPSSIRKSRCRTGLSSTTPT